MNETFPRKAIRRTGRALGSFLFLLFLLFPAAPYTGSRTQAASLTAGGSTFPAQYGEIIFRSNEKSPNQLFIIGMSHRDTFTRANGKQTSTVQAEVVKIGEWLFHNEGLQLILPEGFFKSKSVEVKEADNKIRTGLEAESGCLDLADFEKLRERLSDDHLFVNAEMLLKQSHSMRLRQVEDWPVYEAVSQALLKVVNGGPLCDISLIKELDYLQERRVASMLQKIPDVVNAEFQGKHVQAKKAIFTIGMMHVFHIIKYLNENTIFIRPPEDGSTKREDYVAPLNLSKDNFGITVIIPKSLAENPKALKANNLETIVSQSRKVSLQ